MAWVYWLIGCSTVVAIVLICAVCNAVVEHGKAKYGFNTYKRLRDEERPTWESSVREVPIDKAPEAGV